MEIQLYLTPQTSTQNRPKYLNVRPKTITLEENIVTPKAPIKNRTDKLEFIKVIYTK